MKHTFCNLAFSILLLLPLALFGQIERTPIPFQDYISNSNNSFLDYVNPNIYSYKSQEESTLTKSNKDLIYLDSIVVDNQVTRYVYDELDRLVMSSILTSGFLARRDIYTYLGESALVDTWEIQIFTGSSVSTRAENKFNYDNEQRLDTIGYSERHIPTGATFSSLLPFAYNDEGAVISYKSNIVLSDNSQLTQILFELNYDSLGRIIDEDFYSTSQFNGVFGLTRERSFEYDTLENVVKENFNIFDPSFSVGSIEYTLAYIDTIAVENLVYPSMANPIPNINDVFENQGQLTSVTTLEMDANGNLSNPTVHQYYWSNQETVSVKNSLIQHIDVYPNPAESILNLNLPGLEQDLVLEVFDLMGRKVYTENNLNYQINRVDVSTFAEGIYFLTLSNEKQVLYSSKFTKN